VRKKPRVTYGPQMIPDLKKIWEISERMGSKRLQAFLPEFIPILERHQEIHLEAEIRELLLQTSPSTMDRLLKPYKSSGGRHYTQSPALTDIQSQVPVRTFGEWKGVTPGSLQADLVAHCGESTEGFYLTTLLGIDVSTSWTVLQPVWGKTQQRVAGRVHVARRELPFTLRELHTDNGGEFLNRMLVPWCQREGIRFTRGRPYKKNDQAYVEQRNGAVVRRLVGGGRYSSRAAHEQMKELYRLVGWQINFLQPVTKLVMKERTGAHVKKTYDVPRTPYQRLLASGVLDEDRRRSLEMLYRSLNPVKLRDQIQEARERLWRLEDCGNTKRSNDEPVEDDVDE